MSRFIRVPASGSLNGGPKVDVSCFEPHILLTPRLQPKYRSRRLRLLLRRVRRGINLEAGRSTMQIWISIYGGAVLWELR